MKKFFVLGAVAVVLFLTTTTLVVQFDADVRTKRQNEALISAAKDLESRFFHRHRPELEWLAAQPELRSYLDQSESNLRPLQLLLHQVVGLLQVEVVYLVSRSGTILVATDPAFIGADVSQRDYYRKGMAGLAAYSMAIGLITGTPGLYASVPVYDNGGVVAVLAFRTASTTLERWQANLQGYLIVGPDGLVFSSSESRFDRGAAWTVGNSSRIQVDGSWYTVGRQPLDVVPGYTVVSIDREVWPWDQILLVNLVGLLSLIAGASVWYQVRLAQRRQTEDRERQQRELLLSHLMEGIAVFDADAKMTWANPVFEKLIQREPGSPLPSMGELWDRSGPGPWREVFEGRRPWVVFESILRGSHGAWIPVSAGFTSANGRFLLSVLDGTERYRSDQLLRQSQKLTVLGQLSGGIAHDLNNMLGVLMGMADLLKMSIAETDPLQESVDLILTTLARAASLSEKMLTFARQTPMNRGPLDITALLRELRFLSRTALPEGVRADITAPAGPIVVQGDENLLLSALLNLLLNAGEAMPDGGVVHVTGTESAGRFLIQVEDQGRGMDKATLARIFEPFFSTKLDKKGTGLGLSLVRRTILEHRGTIEVQSSPGKGTTVTVGLPLPD